MRAPLLSRFGLATAAAALLIWRPCLAEAAVAKRAEPRVAVAPARPQGPLTILVSLARQRLVLYDGDRPIATSPVSSGMAGRSTPTGVFSVIQKDRFHKSNIYSDAPMPFMQRITWSGIALHEGHLPGHPASHGCIRMPHDFAVRLWGLTKTGVRVIVSNDEIALALLDHPALLALLHEPAPVAAPPPPAPIEAEPAVVAPLGGGSAAPQVEATPSGPRFVITEAAPPLVTDASDGAAAGAATATASAVAVAPSIAESPAAGAEETVAAAPSALPATPASAAQTAVTPAQVAITTPDAPVDRLIVAAAIKAPIALAAESAIMSEPAPALSASPPPAGEPALTAAPAKPVAAERKLAGPVSVFVSRKEGKIFVRQDFTQIFAMKIAIDRPQQPLGTHVYTAIALSPDHESAQWTVADFPVSAAREASLRKPGHLSDVQPALLTFSSAAEALDRVHIPDEAIERIAPLMTPGSSLIISDAGLGGETGKGTDFIVQPR